MAVLGQPKGKETMTLFAILIVLTLGPFYLFFFANMIVEIVDMVNMASFWFSTSGPIYLFCNWFIVVWGGFGWYCLFT